MKVLVTGACGFAGSHLVEHLLECGDQVVAAAAPAESTSHLDCTIDRIRVIRFDVRDKQQVHQAVADVMPDVIYHLAGVAFLPDAEADPGGLFAINTGGTINLARALLESNPKGRMLFVSSAEVYGQVAEADIPIKETQPIRPANLYAHSKYFAETLLDAERKRGLNAVVIRPFTHIGPRQRPDFSASGFAKQIARIEKHEQEPEILVGNLEARRDVMDVRDMVAAYRIAAQGTDATGPFNIGTGKAYTIRHILDTLIDQTDVEVKVTIDPNRLRPIDIPIYAGDPGYFQSITGWKPIVPLEEMLRRLLNYWRELI